MKNFIIVLLILTLASCQSINKEFIDPDNLTKMELEENYKDSLFLKLSVALDSCLINGQEMETYRAAFLRIHRHSEVKDNKIVVNIESSEDIKIENSLYRYIIDYFNIVNENASTHKCGIINTGNCFKLNIPQTRNKDNNANNANKFVVRYYNKETFRFACKMLRENFSGNTGEIIDWEKTISVMSYNRVYDKIIGKLDSWECITMNVTRYATYQFVNAAGPDKIWSNNQVNSYSMKEAELPSGHIEITESLYNSEGIPLLIVKNALYDRVFNAAGYYDWPNHVPR